MSGKRARNAALAGGLALFGLACGALPFAYARSTPNLYTQPGPLTGSQISRGPFLNSGSRDAGADPDWRGGVWHGRRAGDDARAFSPPAAALAGARAALDAKAAEK